MTKNLNFFNTLSNKKEKFIPLNNNKIGMYVCGPTVYDYPHIGNARPLVVFDVLFRLLQSLYGKNKITYVRNITDIDDKIIESSKKNKKSIKELTETITKSFHEDCRYLNCLKPTFEPKATEHIKGMIDMGSNLLKNKHAYENENMFIFLFLHLINMENYLIKILISLLLGQEWKFLNIKRIHLILFFGNLQIKKTPAGTHLGVEDDQAGI